MTKKEFKNLKRGDIVKHVFVNLSCVVLTNYGDRVTAVRNVDMTNPSEWEIVKDE